uniref:VP7 n=1 Tax=viral metagenome TaxID=1070528 RepID=A0A2V0RAB9_9ZZZZ
MEIASFSRYSDGVKTTFNARKLLRTRQRSILGAFVVSNVKTNIDPNAILMKKENARMFSVDRQDVQELMSSRSYTYDKAIAYYEAVTQIPQASKNLEAYTNRRHKPPLNNVVSKISKSPKIEWYANSWVGNSWVKNMEMKDGGPPCFWTKDHENMDDPFSVSWNAYNVKFINRGRRVAYDTYDTYDSVLAELLEFIDTHSDEDVIHVWIQGTLNGKGPVALVSQLKRSIDSLTVNVQDSEVADTPMISTGKRTSEYLSLWTTPIEQSHDMWDLYGSRPPMRIPLIPWRVTNLGPRIFNAGNPPQLFPATTFMRKMGMPKDMLQITEVYCNYSEFVEMIPLTADDANVLDFGWMLVGDNLYTMSLINESNIKHLYKVKDQDFFNGLGSVVTSAHACFGIGRANNDLIIQLERKQATGHTTSGHMIASVLAFQSHFFWYLQEVYDNFSSGKSVYATKFLEPGSGAYHSIHEYRNAIYDMKRADANKIYPRYARTNLEVCIKFVSLLKV